MKDYNRTWLSLDWRLSYVAVNMLLNTCPPPPPHSLRCLHCSLPQNFNSACMRMCVCVRVYVRISLFRLFCFPDLSDSETLIKINNIGFSLHLTNVFIPHGTPVFQFIRWDVWNWKPSSFSKVGPPPPPPTFFSPALHESYSNAQLSLSLPPPPPPPGHYSAPLSFTSHNIHYITLITRHCHANILPSTGQENNTAQSRTDKGFSFSSHFS